MTTVKPKNKVKFNEGTYMDWRVARKKIETEFGAQKIEGLIDGTLSLEDRRPSFEDAVTKTIEKRFNILQSIYESNVEVLRRKYKITCPMPEENRWPVDTNTGRIPGVSAEDHEECEAALVKEWGSRQRDMVKLEEGKQNLEKDYNQAELEHHKKEKEFDEKVEKGLKILEEHLGPTCLKYIRVPYGKREIKKCFEKLDELYKEENLCEQQVIMEEKLRALRFDPHLQPIKDFIEDLEELFTIMEEINAPLSEGTKIVHLKGSMKRGSANFSQDWWNWLSDKKNLGYQGVKEKIILKLERDKMEYDNSKVIKSEMCASEEVNATEYRGGNSRRRSPLPEMSQLRYRTGRDGYSGCYYCGSTSHMKRECPKMRSASVGKYKEMKSWGPRGTRGGYSSSRGRRFGEEGKKERWQSRSETRYQDDQDDTRSQCSDGSQMSKGSNGTRKSWQSRGKRDEKSERTKSVIGLFNKKELDARANKRRKVGGVNQVSFGGANMIGDEEQDDVKRIIRAYKRQKTDEWRPRNEGERSRWELEESSEGEALELELSRENLRVHLEEMQEEADEQEVLSQRQTLDSRKRRGVGDDLSIVRRILRDGAYGSGEGELRTPGSSVGQGEQIATTVTQENQQEDDEFINPDGLLQEASDESLEAGMAWRERMVDLERQREICRPCLGTAKPDDECARWKQRRLIGDLIIAPAIFAGNTDDQDTGDGSDLEEMLLTSGNQDEHLSESVRISEEESEESGQILGRDFGQFGEIGKIFDDDGKDTHRTEGGTSDEGNEAIGHETNEEEDSTGKYYARDVRGWCGMVQEDLEEKIPDEGECPVDEKYLEILKDRRVMGDEFDSDIALYVHPMANLDFILDSGASRHMCPDINYFDYIESTSGKVVAAGGQVLGVTGIGRIGMLDGVLLVPRLKRSLISVAQLDEEGYTTIFEADEVGVFNRNTKEKIMRGRKIERLYEMEELVMDVPQEDLDTELPIKRIQISRKWDPKDPQKPQKETKKRSSWKWREDDEEEANELDVARGEAARKPRYVSNNMNILEHLHHRWGHIGEDALKEIIKKEGVNGSLVTWESIKDLKMRMCPNCAQGKMTHATFKVSESEEDKGLTAMQLLAVDIKGPFPVASLKHHYKYATVMVFKASRWMMVRFGKFKTEVSQHVEEAVRFAEQRGEKVKVIQGDDDPVFRSAEFNTLMNQRSIEMRRSYPYDHSGNGLIERNIRTLVDMAKTMMLVYNTPLVFWPYALAQAVYNLNRKPRRSRGWKSPYEEIYGKKPDISHLVPFYCPGVMLVTKDEVESTVMRSRGWECRMLGYDEGEGKQGYLIWVNEKREVMRRKQVIFDENCAYQHPEDYFYEAYSNPAFKFTAGNKTEPSIMDRVSFFEEVDEDYQQNQEEELREEEEEMANAVESELNKKKVSTVVKAPYSPKTIAEAREGPEAEKWEKAVREEMNQLTERGTFEVVKDPRKIKKIGKMRFVLQGSLDNNLQPKYKARLVFCGYSQTKGIDYDETYAPTILKDTIFICLCIGRQKGFKMKLLDVKGAFLEGENEHEIYGKIPDEVVPPEKRPMIVRLVLSLYGEKQAANVWFKKLDGILTKIGLDRELEECVYTLRGNDGEPILIINVHVDDILVMGETMELVDEFIRRFRKQVTEIKVYEEVKKYLGMGMRVDRSQVVLDQDAYVKKMLEMIMKRGIPLKRLECPISPRLNLADKECKDGEGEDVRDIIGMFRYLADCTRRDILTAVSMVSAMGANANDNYQEAIHQIIRYLYTTMGKRKMVFAGEQGEQLVLYCFSDASYHNSVDGCDRLGGVFFLGFNNAAIYAYSKKDNQVTKSPMNAEIRAIARNAELVRGYRAMLENFGYEQKEPTVIFTDSLSAIKLFEKGNLSGVRNGKREYDNIRRMINKREIQLIKVDSAANCSNTMTKLVSGEQFDAENYYIERGYSWEEYEQLITTGNIM